MTSHRSDEPRLFWEDFRRFYPVKALALAVIIALTTVSCGKEASLSLAIDDLNYDSLPAKAPRPTKPAEKLHAAVVELKELLAVQSGKNLTEKQAEQARKARAAVAGNLAAVEKQFAADREKLGDLEAKDALKRLAVIEGKTDEIESDLIDALAVVPKSGEKTSSARTAIKQLTALSSDKPQQPLSSDLSFGIKNAKPRSVSLSAGITPAYQAPSPDAEPSSLPREPEPADLEETDETKITPAIEQLATELDHDPVKIYEYVRNNVKFEPYYGIRKGADQTLAEKAGSDADQAALLIALMRESGVPARFVQGVAELPAAKAANWLGVDVANGERMDAVPEILWSGGVPTTPIRANGELKKVRFEHFWVESFVSADSYRGVVEDHGEKRWAALDSSIKQTKFTHPRADFPSLLQPSIEDWVRDTVDRSQRIGDFGIIAPSPADSAQATSRMLDETRSILESHGIDGDSTLTDLIGKNSILMSDDGYLPASAPFTLSSVSREFRATPEQFKASIAVEVLGADPLMSASAGSESEPSAHGFAFGASTDALTDKRITLAYVAAAAGDAEVIDAFHGLFNAPSYSASLIPVLRVGGQVVARGETPIGIGVSQRMRIVYKSPGFSTSITESPVVAGSLSAITLGPGEQSADALAARAEEHSAYLQTAGTDDALTDRKFGEVLSQIGDYYFLRNDRQNRVVEASASVSANRQLSGGVVATDISVGTVGSFPVSTRLAGTFIDVDQDAQAVVAKRSQDDADAYINASGVFASMSEGEVFRQTFGGESASTTSVLAKAMSLGVPIFNIDSESVGTLDSLSIEESVKSEIRSAVLKNGVSAVVPGSSVSLGDWSGVGYVIQDGRSSDYRISGGLSGGANGTVDSPQIAGAAMVPTEHRFIECLAAINDFTDALNLGIGALTGWAAVAFNVVKVGPGLLAVAGTTFAPWLLALMIAISVFLLLQAATESQTCLTGEEE